MLRTIVIGALLTWPASQVEVPARLIAMYVRNGVTELGLDAATADGRLQVERLRAAVVEELTDRALVEAEARRRALPIRGALEQRRHQWIARFGGDAAYRAYLSEHSLSDADVERLIEQEIAGELLRDAFTRETRASDAEIAAYYERHREDPAMAELFVAPEKIRASHILVSARPTLVAPAENAARRQRAEQIRRSLLEGADFATLAREASDDPGTRDRGGDLGWFTRDTHARAFDQAAFALPVGQTSGVIQTEYGFHIIHVASKSPRRLRTLSELRLDIEARIVARTTAERLRQWLEERRRETRVEIKHQ